MKIFQKRSILQKIIIIFVIVILFNYISPTISNAAKDEGFGGVLFKPIQQLVLAIGDGVMWLASASMDGDLKTDNIIKIDTAAVPLGTVGRFLARIAYNGLGIGEKAIADWVFNKITGLNYANDVLYPDEVELPLFSVTPDKIFANQVPFLNVNIMNPRTPTEAYKEAYPDLSDDEINGLVEGSAAFKLQPIISSWYKGIRNLAIVIMLTMLVYIGIRIIISSTASDKSKYKGMIKDWLVAMCLLFSMHYIMSFSITMVEQLTETINDSIDIPAITINLKNFRNKGNFSDYKDVVERMPTDQEGNTYWITDFTGIARFRAQLAYENSDKDSSDYVAEGLKARMAYTILYAILVMYTIMFLFQYLKRMIYIIFLTVISPLVALTYPIDKMNDGSAQAFNAWLKDYVYTLLIQPFHLIIYAILIGSAMDLATEHLIYPLAVFGFMLPAEKIMRKLFNFNKDSGGASFMTGAVGGAMAMTAINQLASRGIKGLAGRKGKGGDSGRSDSNDSRIRIANGRGADSGANDNFIIGAVGQDDGQEPQGLPIGDENRDRNDGRNDNPLNDGNNRDNRDRNGFYDDAIDEDGFPVGFGREYDENGNEILPEGRQNDFDSPPPIDGLPENGIDEDGFPVGFGREYDENGSELFTQQDKLDELEGELDQHTIEEIDANPELKEKQRQYFALSEQKQQLEEAQKQRAQQVRDRQQREAMEFYVDSQEENVPNNQGEQERPPRQTPLNRPVPPLNLADEPQRQPVQQTPNQVTPPRQRQMPQPQRAFARPTPPTRKDKFKAFNKTVISVAREKAPGVALGLAKAVVAGYGAATLGTIGVAAGLASEEYGNVVKYGAAGAAVGAGIGSGVANTAQNVGLGAYRKIENFEEQYNKNLYADDPSAYKEYRNRQADAEFRRNKEIQAQYKAAFGTAKISNGNGQNIEAWKVAMNKAMKYRQHGVTDNEVIINAMKSKVRGLNDDWDNEQRIAAAMSANEVSKPKDIKDIGDDLIKQGASRDGVRIHEQLLRNIKGYNDYGNNN